MVHLVVFIHGGFFVGGYTILSGEVGHTVDPCLGAVHSRNTLGHARYYQKYDGQEYNRYTYQESNLFPLYASDDHHAEADDTQQKGRREVFGQNQQAGGSYYPEDVFKGIFADPIRTLAAGQDKGYGRDNPQFGQFGGLYRKPEQLYHPLRSVDGLPEKHRIDQQQSRYRNQKNRYQLEVFDRDVVNGHYQRSSQ